MNKEEKQFILRILKQQLTGDLENDGNIQQCISIIKKTKEEKTCIVPTGNACESCSG